MAFNNSCTNAVLSASPGPTPKRCEPQLFLAALGQVVRCWKALYLGSYGVMDSARDFNLLGESVPQVRVSAHTIVLLGFF